MNVRRQNVNGVVKSWTWLGNFPFTFHFPALEKEMATHSSVLAWRIPGTGEPGGLPSMGSHRVGHDWSDAAAAAAAAGKIKIRLLRASLGAQTVKNPPAVQETRVQSLLWESLLEKGMATQSSILAWRIPWTEEPGGVSKSGTWLTLSFYFMLLQISLGSSCIFSGHRISCFLQGAFL